MERQIIAYLILALMLAGIAAFVSFKLYHSRERTYRRRTDREKAAYDRSMAERADGRRGRGQ